MPQAMKHWVIGRVDALLMNLGLTPNEADSADQWVVVGIILLLGILIDRIFRLLLLVAVRRIVSRTKASWDDIIFDRKVLRRMCHIITPILIHMLLPVAFPDETELLGVLLRGVQIYIIVAVLRFVNALLQAVFTLADSYPSWQGKPLKGLMQTGQVLAFLVSAILIAAILVDRSPAFLLTGLGASAAVMMLVFKDSILGFVSGIQLSANDMLKVGDWIAMSKYGVDGHVVEVSLTTVKVRNWDNTIVTIPPYLLVSDAVQNWQAMRDTGGRRIKRSVDIDLSTIRFCDDVLLERLSRSEPMRGLVASSRTTSDGERVTNIALFRLYLNDYLRRRSDINDRMWIVVRQLQPTDCGVPIEIYCYTREVDWVPYERIQAEIFDHVLAVVPMFGLRVFQRPSSSDLRALKFSEKE